MERLKKINEGLHKRFPQGHDPFQMVTRLVEEYGELAAQVNHFENAGIKRQKHGEPDRTKLAKEVQDVLTCALQIAVYYGVEAELETTINNSYERMQAERWIEGR